MVLTSEHPPIQIKPPEPQQPPPVGGGEPPAAGVGEAIPSQSPSTAESVTQTSAATTTEPPTDQPASIPAVETKTADLNAMADADFAEISNIVGTINPDASIQEMLVTINQKLADQKKPLWGADDINTHTAKIARALERARERKATEGKPQITSTTESDSEIIARVDGSLAEARVLVSDTYEDDREAVIKFLTVDGKSPDEAAIQAEITRRREALKDHPDLAEAFEIRRKTIEIRKHAKRKFEEAASQARAVGQREPIEQEFLLRYYDENLGHFYELDATGAIAKTYDYNLTLAPYMRALQRLAEEKTGTPPDFSPNAKKAQELLKNLELEKRLITNADGTAWIDKSPTAVEKKKIDAITAADAVSRSIIKKAADDIEAKRTPVVDFYLSFLAMWRKELHDLPADATPETVNAYVAIVTTATNELLETHPEMKNDLALTDTLKLLQGNTKYYSNVANDPLAKRVKEIMKHIKYPPEGGNVDALVQSLGPGKMMLITASLDAAVQADLDHPRPGRKARAAELVDGLLAQGIISGEQGRFLSHLVNQQDVDTFTNTCANQLRLSPDKLKRLSNPLKYLQENAENIANMIFGGKATEKIISAFKALTKLTPEMIAKYVKEHGLPMSQIMIILMVLPMIQGTLGFTGDASEKGEGG